MSFLANFLNAQKTAQVERLVALDGKKTLQSVGNIQVIIQPVSDKDFPLIEGSFADSFKGFCEISADVNEADILTIDSKKHHVKSVNRHDNVQGMEHLTLILECK